MAGELYPALRVAKRAITLTGSNEPVVVYDTSGPYTDTSVDIDVRKGLPRPVISPVSERPYENAIEIAAPIDVAKHAMNAMCGLCV